MGDQGSYYKIKDINNFDGDKDVAYCAYIKETMTSHEYNEKLAARFKLLARREQNATYQRKSYNKKKENNPAGSRVHSRSPSPAGTVLSKSQRKKFISNSDLMLREQSKAGKKLLSMNMPNDRLSSLTPRTSSDKSGEPFRPPFNDSTVTEDEKN